MSDNILLMPFINDSKNFTLGYESATIFEKVQNGETLTDYLFHSENIKQVEIIMKTLLSEFDIEQVNDDWALLNMKSIEI